MPLSDSGPSRELVDAARERLQQAGGRRPPSTAARRYWQLSGGIAQCEVCGGALSPHSVARKSGVRAFYYRCFTPVRRGSRDCNNNHTPRAELLEEAVWQTVLDLISDPHRLLRQYEQHLERQRRQMRGDPAREARSLVEQLEKLERRKSVYLDLTADGVMSRDELHGKLADLDDQRNRLQKAQREAQARQEALRQPQINYAHLNSLLLQMNRIDLTIASPESRRGIYQALKLRVTVDGQRQIRLSGIFDPDVYLPELLKDAGEWLSPRPKVPEGTGVVVTPDNTRRRDWLQGPRPQGERMIELPQLFTARYVSKGVLTEGEVMPVRMSMRPPLVPLPYELEEIAWSLVPEPWMTGEWPWLSPTYWRHLDGWGVEKIGKELAAISGRNGGKDLYLLDHEDVLKGHRSLRLVFSAWWQEGTGQEVLELTDDGRALHYSQLHKRTRPKRPKDPREDHRWTDDEVLGWPISHENFERWARERYWQFARTQPTNPHFYTHRVWGHEETFLRIVLHLREHGCQEVYGGDLYTYYVAGGRKLWTMGADLESTVLINAKVLGQDEGDEAEERPTGGPQPGLFRAGPGKERA